MFWTNMQQNTYFLMQEHRIGWAWPYRYRIMLRENRMEIANSNDILEIEEDWKYLQSHVVPQLQDKIDVWGMVSKMPVDEIVRLVVQLATRAL
jgi:hypothetical protein